MIMILFMLNLGIPYDEEELQFLVLNSYQFFFTSILFNEGCGNEYHMTPVVSELPVAYADWWLPLAD
ncbi:hypothetical protein Tco_0841485 [Tanacetum coccineum]|uniref:Uncharacterized protein n=1 Tax=Tanacetum coccineum TaxID=301880 RepID=A0ABQ5B0E4_9ASTR